MQLFSIVSIILLLSVSILSIKGNETPSCQLETQSSTKKPQARKRILLIGDSITEMSLMLEHGGWGAALSDYYVRAADVLNRGYSGYNTRWMNYLLPQLIPDDNFNKADYILATIMLGSNDCSINQQHVPLTEYKQNLFKIISYLQTQVNPDIKIILITPPPNNPNVRPDRKSVYDYVQIVREVSKESNIPLVDLWTGSDGIQGLINDILPSAITSFFFQPSNTDTNSNIVNAPSKVSVWRDLSDGLHLGLGGNRKVYQGLKNIIITSFPEIIPQKLYHAPTWRELIIDPAADSCRKRIEFWKPLY